MLSKMNRLVLQTPLVVGVAALFTFKRRWWIVNFVTSGLKKWVFVPYHVVIISATIVSLNALPSMVLMLFAVLVYILVIVSPWLELMRWSQRQDLGDMPTKCLKQWSLKHQNPINRSICCFYGVEFNFPVSCVSSVVPVLLHPPSVLRCDILAKSNFH
jgi:hypothetical protein